MKTIGILFITLLCIVPARAVVVTCVSEGGDVVRIDYSATDETALPAAFTLDLTVDGGAIIQSIYDYQVGDSTAASRGYGIFPASMQFDAQGGVSQWGTPDMNPTKSPGVQPGVGTSGVTLGMAARYTGPENAPPATGTLCRLRVDPRGAPVVNVTVAANAAGGGVVLADATTAQFTGRGCTLGGSTPVPPPAPTSLSYPTASNTGTYTVRWAASTGAASYPLERSADGGSTWTSVYAAADVSYAETVPNGSYRYRVRAANSAGASAWTTGTTPCVVSISTQPTVPPAPASITYPATSSTGRYTVSWPASTGAGSYQLERSADNGSTWTSAYSGVNVSYAETVPNGTYRYRVRALNSAGASAWTTGAGSCVVSIIAPPAAGAFRQSEAANGIVSIEAEHFSQKTARSGHTWNLVTAPAGLSGTAAMRAEPDSGLAIEAHYALRSPRLDFPVRFVKTGRHYVWIRAYAGGGDDNACHAGLGGKATKSAAKISKLPALGQWVWTGTADSSRATVNVNGTGVTTVNIWMFKDGFRLDKIVLTTDPAYVPTGSGPAESPRDGGDDEHDDD